MFNPDMICWAKTFSNYGECHDHPVICNISWSPIDITTNIYNSPIYVYNINFYGCRIRRTTGIYKHIMIYPRAPERRIIRMEYGIQRWKLLSSRIVRTKRKPKRYDT